MNEMDDAFKDRVKAFVRAVDDSRPQTEIENALFVAVVARGNMRFDGVCAREFLSAVVRAYTPNASAFGTYAFSTTYAGKIEKAFFHAYETYIMTTMYRDDVMLDEAAHILIATWSADAARFLTTSMSKNERVQFLRDRFDLEGVEIGRGKYGPVLHPQTATHLLGDHYDGAFVGLYREFFGNSDATLKAIFEVELMKRMSRFVVLNPTTLKHHDADDLADFKALYAETWKQIKKSGVAYAKYFRNRHSMEDI